MTRNPHAAPNYPTDSVTFFYFGALKTIRTTILNYVTIVDRHILRLSHCERVRRVRTRENDVKCSAQAALPDRAFQELRSPKSVD